MIQNIFVPLLKHAALKNKPAGPFNPLVTGNPPPICSIPKDEYLCILLPMLSLTYIFPDKSNTIPYGL